ncbi:DEHA2F14322p [Debaryomyces hansenii CBS767]|jgi:20S proteasome subunit beta 7|uniref:Proteasome subunit beta n=1 Tax=Debaryomyces hansenii (strain ATCC 36239 / CBS 767 / BCRC 21394 / JCM 1990 / NBRC 0083 / IGC 2968) TaxID=284592 RepID=Q6BLD6_DEBHA|nr:DEHA2F14322p [Debaryomyces hansenii CBS767]CAG89345.1 DEHA2F14322p [Debaryomyces hansenii CBS767]|eukprot:XP_460985.1 DEHA2F14322p [Debaryomyces hansenii CBS767]
MNHDPFSWGRPSNDVYGQYNHQIANATISNDADSCNLTNFPKMNTQQPIITGTSVVSLKFKDGIIMAADNLGSYGSLLRFTNMERLLRVGKETIVGVSGDISDMQQLERLLEELETTEEVYDNDGGHNLRAPHVHEYLSKVLYNRRSKMNPLWNALVVGGFNDDGTPFLRYVDLLGVTYGSSAISTGFGSHLAVPLLRQLVPKDPDYENVTEEQARDAILNCMRVLFYRDARSLDKFSLVTIKKGEELKFEKNLKCENQSWKFAQDIRGYGSAQL